MGLSVCFNWFSGFNTQNRLKLREKKNSDCGKYSLKSLWGKALLESLRCWELYFCPKLLLVRHCGSAVVVVEWILRVLSFVGGERNLLWCTGSLGCSVMCKTSPKGLQGLFAVVTVRNALSVYSALSLFYHGPYGRWSKSLNLWTMNACMAAEYLGSNQFTVLNTAHLVLRRLKRSIFFLKAKIKYSK